MTTPLIGTTHESETALGGAGFAREEKAELFVAAVSSFSKGGAHEPGSARSSRVVQLTRKVAIDDPRWVMRFDRWLRDEANIRTLTIEVACAFVKARLDAGVPDESHPGTPGMNRTTINVACQRADEPALLLQYWVEHYGRKIPKPVKRGVGDAARRLWTEFSVLKYDTTKNPWRFADVLELCHPKADPANPTQGSLFEWILNRRHEAKDSVDVLKDLPMATANTHLRSLLDSEASKAMLRENLLAEPEVLKEAGWTWENLAGLGPMDKAAWEAIIPQMGYMALMRNLRNFDEAKIGKESFDYVQGRLRDEKGVHRSRVFPFRFYSAFKAAAPHWQPALGEGLQHSLKNVPVLDGRTLILVDCSGSMFYSEGRSTITRMEQAGLFGAAVAEKCEDATLVKYGSGSGLVRPAKAGVLATMSQFTSMGGTNTAGTTREWLAKSGPFKRILIVTDEQTSDNVGGVVPSSTMLYTWNLGGYAAAHAEASATHHSFAGLTDQSFKMIPLIEAGLTYDWPF